MHTISEKAIRFWFRHLDYNSDRAQKLISSSMSRHLSTRNISYKSVHAFLSNLANTDRETDRQTDKWTRTNAFTSSFVGGKKWYVPPWKLSAMKFTFVAAAVNNSVNNIIMFPPHEKLSPMKNYPLRDFGLGRGLYSPSALLLEFWCQLTVPRRPSLTVHSSHSVCRSTISALHSIHTAPCLDLQDVIQRKKTSNQQQKSYPPPKSTSELNFCQYITEI